MTREPLQTGLNISTSLTAESRAGVPPASSRSSDQSSDPAGAELGDEVGDDVGVAVVGGGGVGVRLVPSGEEELVDVGPAISLAWSVPPMT